MRSERRAQAEAVGGELADSLPLRPVEEVAGGDRAGVRLTLRRTRSGDRPDSRVYRQRRLAVDRRRLSAGAATPAGAGGEASAADAASADAGSAAGAASAGAASGGAGSAAAPSTPSAGASAAAAASGAAAAAAGCGSVAPASAEGLAAASGSAATSAGAGATAASAAVREDDEASRRFRHAEQRRQAIRLDDDVRGRFDRSHRYSPKGQVSGAPRACSGPSGVTACVRSNHTSASNCSAITASK